jgi:hypothetical protein
MTVAVYLPLLLAIPLAFGRHWLAGRGTPGTTARVLTGTAAVAAAAFTWSLLLLALTVLDDVPRCPRSTTIRPLSFPSPSPVPLPGRRARDHCRPSAPDARPAPPV